MSSSLTDEITVPGRAELQEVSDGIYAYVQPDHEQRARRRHGPALSPW